MVTSLNKYLKNKLYLIPDRKITNQDFFPTLHDLRGKIVIQGTGDIKKLYPDLLFLDAS